MIKLKNKLINWTKHNTDYIVEETYTFNDWNPLEEVLQVWKRRVNPKTKVGKTYSFNRICDTHYLVLQVFPKTKYYDVLDGRLFNPNFNNGNGIQSFTKGLTFDELIETITDDSCGYDWREIGHLTKGVSVTNTFNHNDEFVGFHITDNSGNEITRERMKGLVL
mgnify:FL=1